ncbi:hypothetical protein M4D57_20280 [Brevibacillus borstelensis]|uniref:hypothetical protein n=1 Tax=Brevibacillus borstelensis TaxID=45462 RepID=UPI00203E3602|nr:hypothetical protein [Brevibacillus borstelensis]MCM3560905.1 hypothetical protein [Brevibacillus borstelensis]
METKICRNCGETKPLNDMVRDSRRKNGRDTICKSCAVKRERARYDSDYHVFKWHRRRAAYGLNLVADGKDYAIASVYLADRPSVSEAIRRAILKAVDLRPVGTEKVVVHARETMFWYRRSNHHRLTQGIVTVPVELRWLPPDKKNTHAFWLAEDAVRRGTTIEEVL